MASIIYSDISTGILVPTIYTGEDFVLIGKQIMHYVYDKDNFQIAANLQVTNEDPDSVGWTVYLAYAYDEEDWSSLEGTRQGQNVDQNRHHDCMFPTGTMWYRGEYRDRIHFGVFARCYNSAKNDMPIAIDRCGLHVTHARRAP